MKEYKSIYSFNILENIKEGETVYYLDRKLHDCGVINAVSVEELAVILKAEGEETGRFEFWTEEDKETKEWTE